VLENCASRGPIARVQSAGGLRTDPWAQADPSEGAILVAKWSTRFPETGDKVSPQPLGAKTAAAARWTRWRQ